MNHDQLPFPEAWPNPPRPAPGHDHTKVPMPKPTRPPSIPAPAILSFRLDEASAAVLSQRAARLGVSPHELAREYVLVILAEAEERAALYAAIVALRQDLGLATGVLLSAAGKVKEDEARAWVKANFP